MTTATATGCPISTTTTDPAGQVLRTVSTTLTADHKSIQSTTQADLNASGKVSARSVVSYTYDGAGRPTSQTTTWAGAAPPRERRRTGVDDDALRQHLRPERPHPDDRGDQRLRHE